MTEFRWVLHDAGGAELRSTEVFASKQEAEAWMGDEWESLLDEGAESVWLVEEFSGKVHYRMGLRPE